MFQPRPTPAILFPPRSNVMSFCKTLLESMSPPQQLIHSCSGISKCKTSIAAAATAHPLLQSYSSLATMACFLFVEQQTVTENKLAPHRSKYHLPFTVAKQPSLSNHVSNNFLRPSFSCYTLERALGFVVRHPLRHKLNLNIRM